jgi:hypothetical protein
MLGWDLTIIMTEKDRLIAMSAGDAELRARLRDLGEEILAATGDRLPVAASALAIAPADRAENVEDPVEPASSGNAEELERVDSDRCAEGPARPGSGREPLKELTLGRRIAPPIQPAGGMSAPTSTDEDELAGIAARCRGKAEAVRWQAESHRRLWEGVESPVEDAAVDPEMLEWADKLVDCFYWLDDQDASQSADLSLLDEVAGCYEAVAEAMLLLAGGGGRRGVTERALPLLAESQSMLRRALQRLRAPDDPDQLAVYWRVRETASRSRIFVKRYMRADDLADPAGWPALIARIESLTISGEQSRQQKARIERVRHHLDIVRQGNSSEQDWQAVVDAVEEMVADGVPPSNREVRDLLLPVVDDLPDRDDLPPGFRLVLREIDRFLGTRTPAPKAAASYVPPAEVKEVARLLEGRSVVLIGGARRREAQATMRRALGLKELIWIETKEHQSIESFEPVIARAEVALVLLAIRWSSHAFGDLRQFCVRHGKPLVRLPGGYGLHQVAAQVLAQCSDLLGGR